MSFESEKEKYIFILDLETSLNQMDLIQNCPILKNVVIFQTVIEEVNARNPAAYNILKNLIEVDVYRKFYIFPNEFFESTYTPIQPNESMEERNERAILQGALYYKDHIDVYYILYLRLSGFNIGY